jgi:hypothetical protein
VKIWALGLLLAPWLAASLAACSLAACDPAKPAEAPAPAPAAAAPDLEHIEGSRMRFFLPDDYERIPHTSTFIHRASMTSLMVVELDGGEKGEAEIIKGFGEKFGVSERHALERDGMQALGLEAEGARGLVIRSGDAVGAVVMSFQDPKRLAEIEGVLNSTHLDPKAELDGLKILGVELALDDLEPHASAGGSVFFLEPDVDPPLPTGAPSIALSYVPTPGGLTDNELGQLVGASLRHLNPDPDSSQVTPTSIDGLAGFELLAKGKQEEIPLTVFAIAVHNDDGTFLFYGSVAADKEAEALPKFRALAASLHRAGQAAAPRPLR